MVKKNIVLLYTLFVIQPTCAIVEIPLISLTKNLENIYYTLAQPHPEELIAWLKEDAKNRIIESDETKNIYQLHVQTQSGPTCTLHSARNIYFMLDMITTTPLKTNYEKIYANIAPGQKAINGFTAFKQSVKAIQGKTDVCLVQFDWVQSNISQGISGLPQEALYLNNKAIALSMMDRPTGIGETNLTFLIEPFKNSIASLSTKHNLALTEEEHQDVVDLWGQNQDYLNNLYDFSHSESGYLGIVLDVYTIMGHVVALVIAKNNGKIYSFFADSLGSSFATGWSGNYKKRIDYALRLIANPAYTEKIFSIFDITLIINNINRRLTKYGDKQPKRFKDAVIADLKALKPYAQTHYFKTIIKPLLIKEIESIKNPHYNETKKEIITAINAL